MMKRLLEREEKCDINLLNLKVKISPRPWPFFTYQRIHRFTVYLTQEQMKCSPDLQGIILSLTGQGVNKVSALIVLSLIR